MCVKFCVYFVYVFVFDLFRSILSSSNHSAARKVMLLLCYVCVCVCVCVLVLFWRKRGNRNVYACVSVYVCVCVCVCGDVIIFVGIVIPRFMFLFASFSFLLSCIPFAPIHSLVCKSYEMLCKVEHHVNIESGPFTLVHSHLLSGAIFSTVDPRTLVNGCEWGPYA